MARRPTYEELEQRVKELEKEAVLRKQAEEALRQSEELYRSLVEGSIQGITILQDDIIQFANQAFAKIFGYTSPDELVGKNLLETLIDPEEWAELKARNAKLLSGKPIPVHPGWKGIHKDGTRIWIQSTASPISLRDRPASLAFYLDVTELKKAEEALRENEENFRALADNANDGIAMTSGEGTYVYVNKRFAEITGYSISELLKIGFKELVHPDELMKIKERYKRRLEGKHDPRSYETTIIRKDRKELPVDVTGAKTIWHGQPAVMVIIRDIIKRKQAEQLIMASLKEKEVLLKEIHHRVKNNLQIISSLLDMRIMRTDNQQVIDLFEDTRSKIHTMALIHSQLYRSKRFDKINMGTHIQELVDYLSKIYAKRDVLITPIVECSDIYLSINQAIPCALVLNELLSNAFKHAFQEGQKGTIEISLNRQDHNEVFLKVKDNGIGIPKEIDIFTINSLGFKLMRNTVQHQLMGKIHIERDAGTTIIVRFKILEEG